MLNIIEREEDMPWEHQKVELVRIEFVFLASHESVNFSQLCREFNISRKTGYKWLNRYRSEGIQGLRTRSHRRHNYPEAIPGNIVAEIIRLRNLHPGWGPKKLRVLMLRENFSPDDIPSISSIVRILKKAGLSVPKGRGRPRKYKPSGDLTEAKESNQVWTADLKGWWRTKDGSRCEPLTVRDLFSRYILCAKPLQTKSIQEVQAVFENLFQKHGLPDVIRTDNGTPFASLNGLHGLTKLSAWWISLGIKPERIRLGHPEDNGGHERMHADIAREIERRPALTVKDEAIRLENWRLEFNNVRPHESLKLLTPSQIYRPSSRFYGGIAFDYDYPETHEIRKVKKGGTIVFRGEEIYISQSLSGFKIGLKKIDSVTYEATFCGLRLGEIFCSSDSKSKFVVRTSNPMNKKM